MLTNRPVCLPVYVVFSCAPLDHPSTTVIIKTVQQDRVSTIARSISVTSPPVHIHIKLTQRTKCHAQRPVTLSACFHSFPAPSCTRTETIVTLDAEAVVNNVQSLVAPSTRSSSIYYCWLVCRQWTRTGRVHGDRNRAGRRPCLQNIIVVVMECPLARRLPNIAIHCSCSCCTWPDSWTPAGVRSPAELEMEWTRIRSLVRTHYTSIWGSTATLVGHSTRPEDTLLINILCWRAWEEMCNQLIVTVLFVVGGSGRRGQ